jgi:hypothetical protein
MSASRKGNNERDERLEAIMADGVLERTAQLGRMGIAVRVNHFGGTAVVESTEADRRAAAVGAQTIALSRPRGLGCACACVHATCVCISLTRMRR